MIDFAQPGLHIPQNDEPTELYRTLCLIRRLNSIRLRYIFYC